MSIDYILDFLISHLSEGFCVYFMQLVELALIKQPNSTSPKIKQPTPVSLGRLVAELFIQITWFPGSVAEGAEFSMA